MSSSPACTCLTCPAYLRSSLARCEVYPASATTDAQWALIAPLLPAPASSGPRGGRPEKHDRRLVVDAIFHLVHGGVAWRELPREYPSRSTVWSMLARWVRSGAWKAVHDALVDALRAARGRLLLTAAIIDSQSVRAADTVPAATRGHPRLGRG